MIIDNKQDRDPNDGINTTTVWDYMKYYTDPEKGREGILEPEFGIRLSQKVNYATRHDSSSLHIGEWLSMFCKKPKDSLIG